MAYKIQIMADKNIAKQKLNSMLLEGADYCVETGIETKPDSIISTVLVEDVNTLSWLLFGTTVSGCSIWSLNEIQDGDFQRALEEKVLEEEKEIGYSFEQDSK